MSEDGKNGQKTGREAGGRFGPGNPGKPRGARHKSTLALEALLDGEAEEITRKVIELALGGDLAAIRLCLERLVPPRKDRPIAIELPPLQNASDVLQAQSMLLTAVAMGEVTPGEASEVGKLLDGFAKTLELTEFEARLARLEGLTK